MSEEPKKRPPPHHDEAADDDGIAAEGLPPPAKVAKFEDDESHDGDIHVDYDHDDDHDGVAVDENGAPDVVAAIPAPFKTEETRYGGTEEEEEDDEATAKNGIRPPQQRPGPQHDGGEGEYAEQRADDIAVEATEGGGVVDAEVAGGRFGEAPMPDMAVDDATMEFAMAAKTEGHLHPDDAGGDADMAAAAAEDDAENNIVATKVEGADGTADIAAAGIPDGAGGGFVGEFATVDRRDGTVVGTTRMESGMQPMVVPMPIDDDEEEAARVVEHDGTATAPPTTLDDVAKPTADEDPNKRTKKERREFTAEEKIRILSELEGPDPTPIQTLLRKYGVSKSSLHRWRQPEKMERLYEMVKGRDYDGTGTAGSTNNNAMARRDRLRKRDMNDKLRKIKVRLDEFCKHNLTLDEDHQLAITSSLIQIKAAQIKDELLEKHEEFATLTEEEEAALRAFKGSKSWACLIGNQLGYLSTAGAVVWSEKARANTASYVDAHSRSPTRPKKQRMEFTAHEKLAILQELEETNVRNKTDGVAPMTVDAICAKYHTSKSSLHRWKQQYRSGFLQKLAERGSGFANSKRIFNDKLHAIKRILNDFYIENENAPLDKKISIGYATLQARAIMAKESLLNDHFAAFEHRAALMVNQQQDQERTPELKPSQQDQQEQTPELQPSQQDQEEKTLGDPQQGQEGEGEGMKKHDREGEQQSQPQRQTAAEGGTSASSANVGAGCNIGIMSQEEVYAIEHFKASNSWLRETAKKFGWKLDIDKRVLDASASAAAALYHHLDHQHVVVDHPLPEQHPAAVIANVGEYPIMAEHNALEHPVAAEHHDVSQDQIIAVEEAVVTVGDSSGAAAVEGEQHHHDHAPNSEVDQDGQQEGANSNHHYQREEQQQLHHPQQQEQEQPVDHLAPNMLVYEAQGNPSEMVVDSLVHVDVEGVDPNENSTVVNI